MNKGYSKAHEDFLKSVKRRKKTILIAQISLFILFLIAWELAAKYKLIDVFLFSHPTDMWDTLVNLFKSGSLFTHIGISVLETVIGFLGGTILGTIIAIILWWSDFLREVLDPYMVVLNALPKTALAPIIIVWVGAGMSGIIVTALSVTNALSFKKNKVNTYLSINLTFYLE